MKKFPSSLEVNRCISPLPVDDFIFQDGVSVPFRGGQGYIIVPRAFIVGDRPVFPSPPEVGSLYQKEGMYYVT